MRIVSGLWSCLEFFPAGGPVKGLENFNLSTDQRTAHSETRTLYFDSDMSTKTFELYLRFHILLGAY